MNGRKNFGPRADLQCSAERAICDAVTAVGCPEMVSIDEWGIPRQWHSNLT